ncbi:MAG: hypothetical protein K2X31_03275, partial [Sphingopyxis sp.]|nr:hypothetical protein [Sphingopyxis sp.]
MMEGFGLGTRRTVAVGLFLLAFLLVVDLVVTPLVSGISGMRAELGLLKAREARLEAARDWPSGPSDASRYDRLVLPGGEAEAREALAARIEAAAGLQGLDRPAAAITATPRGQGLALEARLAVSGPHDAVLGFIAELEGGAP